MSIENITVRFFIVTHDSEEGPDLLEVGEAEFLEHEGDISYERHSVFDNGVRQICLTKGLDG